VTDKKEVASPNRQFEKVFEEELVYCAELAANIPAVGQPTKKILRSREEVRGHVARLGAG
jgi:hypothetical protein